MNNLYCVTLYDGKNNIVGSCYISSINEADARNDTDLLLSIHYPDIVYHHIDIELIETHYNATSYFCFSS